MALTIGELVAFITAKDKGFHKALDAAERHMDRLGKATGGIGKIAGLAVLAGQAINLTAALAPAAGAMLAMPAAMAVTKVASGTLKLGLQGVSEAMGAISEGDAKKLEAALKELSPAARGFVKELGSLKAKGFDPIQKAVQSKLLGGLVEPLRTAASNVIPAARAGLVGMAGALNGVAKEGLRVAATPMFRSGLSKVFSGTTGVVNTLKGAVGPLATILLKLINLGMPLTQRMAGWAVAGAKAAAAFLSSRDGAEKMSGIVQRAGDTLATLGRIVGNIGSGLVAIFKNAGSSSGDLLATIEKLTAKFAAWAQSAKGQQQIGNVFSLLAETGRALGGVLPLLVGPLGAIASLLTSLPPGAQGAVAQILAFSVVAGALASKLTPLIGGVRLLASGIGKIGPAAKGLQGAALWLGKIGTAAMTGVVQASAALGRFVLSAAVAAGQFAVQAARMVASMALTAARIVGGWVLMGVQSLLQAARVAAAWVIAMGPIGWVIAAVIALVALIIANWDTIKAAIGAAWEWVQEKTVGVWNAITGALSAAWEGIKSAAAATWEWIKNAVKKSLDFISRFFMPFALVRLIVENWDKIKAGAKAAWDWIVSKIQAAVRLVIAGVTWLSELPGKVGAWFGQLKDAAIKKATELLSWIKELPGKIVAGLGKIGQLLLGVGKDLILGLINGAKAMAQKLIDMVKGVINDAINGAKKLLGIASPSKVAYAMGSFFMIGFVNAIQAGAAHLTATLDGVLTATLTKARKKVAEIVQVLSGGERSGVFNAGAAADGEIAKMLGGAKFGLKVNALTPTPAPTPKKPAPKKKPSPRSDPNDVTYDRGPKKKPTRDPNDVTVDRGPSKKPPRRDPNDVTFDRGPTKKSGTGHLTAEMKSKPKDNAGYIEPSAFNVTNHFHAANMSADQVSRTMWLQAHAAGF